MTQGNLTPSNTGLTTTQHYLSCGATVVTLSLPVGGPWKPSVTLWPVSMSSKAQGIELQSLLGGPLISIPSCPSTLRSCLEYEPDQLEFPLFSPDIRLSKRTGEGVSGKKRPFFMFWSGLDCVQEAHGMGRGHYFPPNISPLHQH